MTTKNSFQHLIEHFCVIQSNNEFRAYDFSSSGCAHPKTRPARTKGKQHAEDISPVPSLLWVMSSRSESVESRPHKRARKIRPLSRDQVSFQIPNSGGLQFHSRISSGTSSSSFSSTELHNQAFNPETP